MSCLQLLVYKSGVAPATLHILCGLSIYGLKARQMVTLPTLL